MKHYYVIDESRNYVRIDETVACQELYYRVRKLLYRMKNRHSLREIEQTWVDYGDGEVSFTISVKDRESGLYTNSVDYYISLKCVYLESLLLAEQLASESVPVLTDRHAAMRAAKLAETKRALIEATASDDFVIQWAGDPRLETYTLYLRSTKIHELDYLPASPLMTMKSVLYTFHDIWVMYRLSLNATDDLQYIAERVGILNSLSNCYLSIWSATGWRQEKCSRELDFSSVIARHLYQSERKATHFLDSQGIDQTLPSSSHWQVQLKISAVRRVLMLLWLYPMSTDNLALVKYMSEAL